MPKIIRPRQPLALSPITANSILLVEDNNMMQVIVCTLFQILDCSVDSAKTVAEAYEKIHTNHYALILMDLGLPDGSGLDVARAVRQLSDPQRAATPIVALSAHLDEALRQQCLDVGMQSALTKPLMLAQAEQLRDTYLSVSKNPEEA